MRYPWIAISIALTLTPISTLSAGSDIKNLKHGWFAITSQEDPFDSKKTKFLQIHKGDFTFRCGSLNFLDRESSFDGFSFDATLKYIVDDGEVVTKSGEYSTYLQGSSMINDKRYYSFTLNDYDVDAMKAGNSIKVAGKYSGINGWETRTLNLAGFTSAYSKMCE